MNAVDVLYLDLVELTGVHEHRRTLHGDPVRGLPVAVPVQVQHVFLDELLIHVHVPERGGPVRFKLENVLAHVSHLDHPLDSEDKQIT